MTTQDTEGAEPHAPQDIGLPTTEVYSPPARVREGALVTSREEYERLHRRSIEDPDAFWAEMANQYLDWMAPFTRVMEEDLSTGRFTWFRDGKLNVTTNCLDRHLDTRGDQVAILWEGDEPANNRRITYRDLHAEVCRLANELKSRGIDKGDRVAIYMGMVPELAVAMLACARIGAIHSVIFGGFSARSIADRLQDSRCKAVITQDQGRRGGRLVTLKQNVDEALTEPNDIEFVLVYRHTGAGVPMQDGRDFWWHETVANQPPECPPARLDAEDPLFILYTSGSTGKPKGVLHTQAGYLLYAMLTHRYIFDVREDDIFCCAADVGWVTGHSYIVYGPLANGATTVMFESIPTYPDAGRYWDMVDRLGITILLHRTHRDPRHRRRGRSVGPQAPAHQPAGARVGGRAHQPGGLALVLQRGRRGALLHRRYLLADRDGRDPDHRPRRRQRYEAGVGVAPLLRGAAVHRR